MVSRVDWKTILFTPAFAFIKDKDQVNFLLLRCYRLAKFENAPLFRRGHTKIRHENGTFRNCSSNRRNLKAPFFLSSRGRNTFENGACDFPGRVFRENESKMTGDCYVFKLLRCSVDGKHLTHFHFSWSGLIDNAVKIGLKNYNINSLKNLYFLEEQVKTIVKNSLCQSA